MNLILLEESEISNGRAVLSGHRSVHIQKILKAEIGTRLRTGIVSGSIGVSEVLEISGGCVTIDYTAEGEPPAAPDISLVLALPRPKVFRRVLFSAVSAGVKDIHIINSWRVEKSYWDSPYISQESVALICREALAQAKDTVLPDICFHRFFMEFVETGLVKIPAHRGRYVAHPYAEENCKAAVPAVVAIGPEGGFVQRELETFERYGFRPFSLSERILTTEHFVPFLLGSLIS